MPKPGGVRTTVVVVTWCGVRHLNGCLDALATQGPHAALVVDNASDDGSAKIIAAHPSAPDVLRLPRNLGYAGGLAEALRQVKTPFVAWLNDDAEPSPGWLTALEEALDTDPAAAAAGAVLTHADGTIQTAGVRLTADGHGADLTGDGSVFGFCGGAVLLRTAALRAVGGIPAGFFCYYEDTDTAWRLRLAGWRILRVDAARARHKHGASAGPANPAFHRWNERNRLLTLLRCAPGKVAFAAALRFLAITLALPLRRLRGAEIPAAPNFRVRLRLLVIAEIMIRLPVTLWSRFAIGRRATLARSAVWRAWAGR
jgi:hypothetical protein